MILGLIIAAIFVGFIVAPAVVLLMLAICAPLYIGYMGLLAIKERNQP